MPNLLVATINITVSNIENSAKQIVQKDTVILKAFSLPPTP
ncbi:hypothetical protein [Bartonella birtlesii]|uniref:Uncharacterized protein n=1 Tax=Bartonella birtlesii LL-WM9 TaxID=1094552 RepID=J1ITV2_9HYPH|nr:hypothetical protein [Bartonella birtlesii]EJF74987.1 hypothetical protein ME7_01358 [Bartonella birtlesii LL-WM9]